MTWYTQHGETTNIIILVEYTHSLLTLVEDAPNSEEKNTGKWGNHPAANGNFVRAAVVIVPVGIAVTERIAKGEV